MSQGLLLLCLQGRGRPGITKSSWSPGRAPLSSIEINFNLVQGR